MTVLPAQVKPVVDLAWFTFVCKQLLGWRNTSLLYVYMVRDRQPDSQRTRALTHARTRRLQAWVWCVS